MYTWTCKQDHFNDISVAEMLDFINLREKKDERHKRESINNLLEEAIIENGAKEHLKFIETLNNASLDELVSAIERKGWEVTIKHIIKECQTTSFPKSHVGMADGFSVLYVTEK
jgi:hypothetical protein